MAFVEKVLVQKPLHIREACYLSFHLKKKCCLSPNPAEVIGIFPEAVRNF